ncbi:DUF3784 domain-containing protein [Lancefieldella rimae]|uniref:DUF3784 domain-containing protein n=1 Tax=Lancefieldella rimae TaxID=1383 RepID=UPI0028E84537|nr:DUF3784 domain-containing protein [Lancefieldella rimae]
MAYLIGVVTMTFSIILWTLTIILAIWSLVLLSGHGTTSIAGFNTMTADEKKTINEKKLCFVMGICMLVCTLVIFYLALLYPNITTTTALIAGGIIAIDCVVTIYLVNTKCKTK